MTPGRKFSTTTSAVLSSLRKISLPSSAFRLRVSDFLLAFWARKLVPISCLLSVRHVAQLAGQVAAVGVLDLDHLGAQQRQVHGGERAGQDVGQVQDPDVFQQFHGDSPLLRFLEIDDRTRLENEPGQFAVEERGRRRRAISRSLSRWMSRDQPMPLQRMDEVLGADIAGRPPW